MRRLWWGCGERRQLGGECFNGEDAPGSLWGIGGSKEKLRKGETGKRRKSCWVRDAGREKIKGKEKKKPTVEILGELWKRRKRTDTAGAPEPEPEHRKRLTRLETEILPCC